MKSNHLMKIGELAERAGTTPRTIRLYQELGLLQPADRSKGGFRLFSEEELRKLRFIHELKLLDIPLAQIAALFEARTKGTTTREAADQMICELRAKLNIVNSRIASYLRMKEEIEQIIRIYSDCPECGALPSKGVCYKCQMLTSREYIPDLLEAIL